MEWINIKDKTPANGQHVIIIRYEYGKFYLPDTALYISGEFRPSMDNYEYYKDNFASNKITHWMPLPPSPQEIQNQSNKP